MSRVQGLAHVHIESGVSAFTGKGFCAVHAIGEDGQPIAGGQLTPEQVRTMALGWLGAAEAAEHDAAVVAELVEQVGLSQQEAAAFLHGLRKRREAR